MEDEKATQRTKNEMCGRWKVEILYLKWFMVMNHDGYLLGNKING